MTHANVDDEAEFGGERFTAETVAESERSKTVLGYFAPGQFIPVHVPDSDVTVVVQSGAGLVRDGEAERAVGPGDVVVVPAGEQRGVRASEDGRLTAVLVTAPPPGDAAHEPVREGIRRGEFDPGAQPSD